MRYEITNTISETKGRGSALRDPVHDSQFVVAPPLFDNPSRKNCSPRLGFAWDITGNSKMALRGGAGLLYDVSNIAGAAQINATATPPFSSNNTITTNLGFPFTAVPAVSQRALRMIDWNLQQPHLLQYNLTLERQLPASMVVSIAYAGSRGINLYGTTDGNPTYPSAKIGGRDFWTGNESRINPAWADMEFITAGMDSWYNSMQLGFQKHLSRGLQFQTSYTWGKSLEIGRAHV